MRIAINITREIVSGITSANISLLNHLSGNNHEFVGIELNIHPYMKGPVIFRSFSPETFDHHIINIHDKSIGKIIKKSKELKNIGDAYKDTIQYIRKILKETKPDCVLLNGTYSLPWLIAIAAHKENVPIVLWYAGVLTREVVHYPPKIRKIFEAMERSIIKLADKIIFPSRICRDVVEAEVAKTKLKNAHVIPNPLNPIFTEPSAIEQSIERRIAAVGRYTPVKNFDEFFAIHKQLKNDKWYHTASFVTKIGKIKSLPKDINLLPPMTPQGLKRFYLTQGLLICPSHFETFGYAPMEAACLGIPVLVNKTMGCADILKQVGLENMVIDFTDRKAAIERIKKLCGQYILPKQLNALRKILDYRFVGDEIEAVLESVLKQ